MKFKNFTYTKTEKINFENYLEVHEIIFIEADG